MRFFKFLRAPWFLGLIGVLFLSVLIWLLGPLLGFGDSRPLEPELIRILVIVGLLVIWLIFVLIGALRRRANNEKMVKQLTEAATDDASVASSEELDVLREKLTEALGTLKKTKFGGSSGAQYLYQLPWYIMIGPPGSGKTTALLNSGLKFPLESKIGREVRGVGGTRNCEWLFTDEAVLIDTAGRYTTQDSYKEVDATVWTGFLNLLKKFRPRQPINGAMLAISLSDLATLSDTQRAEHAATMRTRLAELHEQLGIRFPIYVLFTKADLIAGFREFYDDMRKQDREQVWGFTFPLQTGKGPDPLDSFEAEFDLLIERLNKRLVERIHAEPDLERRALIYSFPMQTSALKEVAREFLTDIFKPTRYAAKPMLRGVYFTSGTQEGTPIDRLMGQLAASFGLDRLRLKSQSPTGRSYFLNRLLTGVVFKEANIVGTNRRVERGMRLVRRVALAAAVVAIVGMGAAWFYSYSNNRGLISDVDAATLDYVEKVQPVNQEMVGDTDFAQLLPALDTLRNMPAGYTWQQQSVPISWRLGLYQGNKLGDLTGLTYDRALNALLLPRLILRLDAQVRAGQDQSEFLYQALKLYLMLGGQGPLDPELIRQWFTVDWQTSFPGTQNQATRESLSGHLDALLETQLRTITLDGRLVESARARLAEFPLPERAYRIIKDEAQSSDLPEWQPIQNGGPAINRVFIRDFGRPLTEGINGLYTFGGFHGVFLPLLETVVEEVVEESWVMGPQGTIDLSDAGREQLKASVSELYYNDFVTQWDTLLGDLRIVPFQDLGQAVQVLNFLSAADSPLRKIVQSVATETKLTDVPAETDDASLQDAANSAVAQTATRLDSRLSAIQRLNSLLGQTAPQEGAPEVPGQYVDDRFDTLQALADAGSPLDATMSVINDAYQELSRVDNSLNAQQGMTQIVREGGAAGRLTQEASRLPQPVSTWIAQIGEGIAGITTGGAQSAVNDAYKADVLPVCKQITENRFPIFGGASDVALNDFTRLFAPGGVLDNFFNQQLANFVDRTADPWRWQRLDLSPDSLVQFQRAQVIRDAFFPAGGTPQIQFDISPVSLDLSASQVILEVGGQILTYGFGPIRPMTMRWPDASGPNLARLSFSPPIPGESGSITTDGPWAFFRLLNQAQISRTASDKMLVTWNVGLRSATFEVTAGSVANPFTMPELREFRCPASL